MEDRICLDTNILVDILRGNIETTELVNNLEENHILSTTYINLFELYYGAALSTNKNINFAAVKKLANTLSLLNLSDNSAKKAGIILADLKNKGLTIEFKDLLIASIAMDNSFSLLTNNKKHFDRINGLRIV